MSVHLLNIDGIISLLHFSVYVETGSSTTSTTLAFTIGAATGARSWKVITVLGFLMEKIL
jgi:hypothetical protein